MENNKLKKFSQRHPETFLLLHRILSHQEMDSPNSLGIRRGRGILYKNGILTYNNFHSRNTISADSIDLTREQKKQITGSFNSQNSCYPLTESYYTWLNTPEYTLNEIMMQWGTTLQQTSPEQGHGRDLAKIPEQLKSMLLASTKEKAIFFANKCRQLTKSVAERNPAFKNLCIATLHTICTIQPISETCAITQGNLDTLRKEAAVVFLPWSGYFFDLKSLIKWNNTMQSRNKRYLIQHPHEDCLLNPSTNTAFHAEDYTHLIETANNIGLKIESARQQVTHHQSSIFRHLFSMPPIGTGLLLSHQTHGFTGRPFPRAEQQFHELLSNILQSIRQDNNRRDNSHANLPPLLESLINRIENVEAARNTTHQEESNGTPTGGIPSIRAREHSGSDEDENPSPRQRRRF